MTDSNATELITQHVITKGGEFYSRNLGLQDDFNAGMYIAKITNIPPYNIVEVDEDTWVNFDSVLKLWFTKTEVH